MEKIDIAIIGAGIIGLAISAAISDKKNSTYVLEKNISFGQEASSRNSEVIHAGIYYPENSLKGKTCVEGNILIYEICAKNKIAYKKTGKLILAHSQEEVNHLHFLLQNGERNGITNLKILSAREVDALKPNITAQGALFSPNTGIVDTHNLMLFFLQKAKAQGAEFAFCSEVTELKRQSSGYKITIRDADRSSFCFLSDIVINCAGLSSDVIAQMAGIDTEKAGYVLKYCKGEYFRVSGRKAALIKNLIYPVPDNKGISLGIHATPDLNGSLRLGPDAEYIKKEKADYSINEEKKKYFWQSVQRFLPFLDYTDLVADTAGIRAKLQGPQEGFRDFVIAHEDKKGFPGLINLIGIDSPGLTAAAAIAKYVKNIIKGLI